ncbi:GUN4 domain-containing protein [Leptothermofonsia sichuanensis E412]|uniref:GUN4 domain-containing protein n=1 Tax=Leptothermofonsia sichuanensis TaxID=2917832 RepID=UPI001CA75620|nr:GUN4 domain-containing protein [Leptothermofonsia sichuanensis]QZZ21307.1 GUN4 domain-containing protein [Leptothermofonsia sichuanensis E412]
MLYFSGHGVRDDNGTLYFATRITEKNPQGHIRTSTAVPATALQQYMSRSRSRRQVLILDCCFSGAFANDMKAKAADEAVDVKNQLGGEGRAVLTSSTATQVSYEKEGSSLYTRYLVKGLETGAADRNNDGQITVDELHEYAREKVQEAAPTMQPEIYAVKEGYKILIARAPQDDPKLVYRKELDERARQKRGKLSPVERRALKFRWQELGLSPQVAETIESEVLQPYQVFWDKLDEFEQAVRETLEYDPQFSTTSRDDLQYLQRVLKLRDEDVASVLATCQVNLTPPTQSREKKPSEPNAVILAPAPPPSVSPPPTQDDLKSEKGIDYTRLRDLLKAQDWKGADYETYLRMLEAIGRKEGDWIRAEELKNFPCADLKTIDRLWVRYSNGHFGFSVQKKIWQECGSPQSTGKDWDRFCVRVGWQNKDASAYVPYSDFKFDLNKSPKGELPRFVGVAVGGFGGVVGGRFFVGGLVGGWSLLSHQDL